MERESITVPKMTICPYEKPYGYIYLYTNLVNGHRYIGKHKFNKPYIDTGYRGSGTQHWSAALKKYGWENFSKEVLFWLEYDPALNSKQHNEILNEKERYFIDLLGTYENPNDYNETPGGDGSTPEMMMGEKNPMYGKRGELSPTWGMRGEKAPWWGKHHTEESKEKIRQANLGKVFSQEHRDKIALANTGHIAYETQREAARKVCQQRIGSNNPMWKGGKTIKNKTHSEFMKGKRMSPKTEFNSENSSGGNNSQAKAVVQLTENGELVKEYSYVGEVNFYGFNDEGVRKCCKGKQAKYKGYRWMYKDDYVRDQSILD